MSVENVPLYSNEGDQWVNYKGVDINGVQLKKKSQAPSDIKRGPLGKTVL